MVCVVSALLLVGTQEVGEAQRIDFDGDGRSDYAVARAVDSALDDGSQPQGVRSQRIEWHLDSNNQPEGLLFGLAATDFLTPADFDGDGKDDPAVWRTGPPTEAAFYILESSTGRARQEHFGQTGDDALVVGDYDGDGRADPAVFRCPVQGGSCTFFYRGSRDNPEGHTTYMPWGSGASGQLFAYPGDFDGDGKFDYCLQRAAPGRPSQGQFLLLRSSDFGSEVIDWGRPNDRLAPGDFNGDGRHDYVVVRVEDGQLMWYGLYSDGSGGFEIPWGLEGDLLTPGDYDGDGAIDLSVWRVDPRTGAGRFLTLKSSDGTTDTTWLGRSGDYPIAEFPVH